jgi:hypothetical protein
MSHLVPLSEFTRYWLAVGAISRGWARSASGEETQIVASFCAAIHTAPEQKSISLEKRAEGTYTEYRRQKARGSEGRRFRVPLW